MGSPDSFRFQVYFDGECPLCMREIRWLQGRDKAGAVHFTDIAASDFDPASLGLTMQTMMDSIHGRMPDGTVVEGVEVFRQLYAAVGLGYLMGWTTAPGLSNLADWAYARFAKRRLKLTGRCRDGVCATATTG